MAAVQATKKIIKIENKRILLQTSSFNFQKKTNFIKITLLTVTSTKISIVDGSTLKIFAFYQPFPLSIFSGFSDIPLLNVGQYVFLTTFSCI